MSEQNFQDARPTAKKLRVINIGLQTFYEALLAQDAQVTQLDWRPPVQQSAEIEQLLDSYL